MQKLPMEPLPDGMDLAGLITQLQNQQSTIEALETKVDQLLTKMQVNDERIDRHGGQLDLVFKEMTTIGLKKVQENTT